MAFFCIKLQTILKLQVYIWAFSIKWRNENWCPLRFSWTGMLRIVELLLLCIAFKMLPSKAVQEHEGRSSHGYSIEWFPHSTPGRDLWNMLNTRVEFGKFPFCTHRIQHGNQIGAADGHSAVGYLQCRINVLIVVSTFEEILIILGTFSAEDILRNMHPI